MEFKVEAVITWEDYAEFISSFGTQHRFFGPAMKGASWFYEGWRLLFGGFLTLFGAPLFFVRLFRFGSVSILGGAMLLGGLFLLSRRFKSSRERYFEMMLSRRPKEVEDKPMRFLFDEEGFEVWESGEGSSYRYHSLTDVWEDQGRFYLFMRGKMEYILPKAGFVLGEPSVFEFWIAKKLGKDVVKI